jgi:hypothetical protein
MTSFVQVHNFSLNISSFINLHPHEPIFRRSSEIDYFLEILRLAFCFTNTNPSLTLLFESFLSLLKQRMEAHFRGILDAYPYQI